MSRCISYFQDGDLSAIAMLVNATHFGFPKNVNSSPLKSSPPKTERIVFQTSFFRSGFFKLPGSIRSTVLTVAGYHFLLLPLVGWGIYEKKIPCHLLKSRILRFQVLATYNQFFELLLNVFLQACRLADPRFHERQKSLTFNPPYRQSANRFWCLIGR